MSSSAGALQTPAWKIVSKWRVAAVLAAILVVILVPFAGNDYTVGVAVQVAIVLGLAQSYDLLVGRTGAFSFAHAAFFGSGSYVTAIMLVYYHAPFMVGFILSIVVAILLGTAIGIPSFRLSLHSFAMGTFGFAAILQLLALNWIPVTRGPLCMNGVPPLAVGIGPFAWQANTLTDYYYVLWGAAGLILLIVWRVARSRIGRVLTAIRDDPILAGVSGVPVLKYRMFAFLLGGALAAAVGAIVAPYLSVVCPTSMGLPAVGIGWMITLIVVVFLGGRGSLVGVTLGAVLFTVLPEFLRVADTWRMVVYGALIMLGALYAPRGLAGLGAPLWRSSQKVMAWMQRSSR
jgi:ABC-type branched-subunit amino acid transport system permease subunit